MSEVKRLIWDIETAPNESYLWRAGFGLNIGHHMIKKEREIICICYKWEGEDDVWYDTWDEGSDRRMVSDFMAVASEADELIAHNGDRFDMRWFKGRCVIHDLPVLPPTKTVDTCKITRKHFDLNSYRLDYLCKLFFNKGKLKTDFDLWVQVMEGSSKALDEMVDYCCRDVVLTERLWGRIRPYHKPQTHAGVLNHRSRWTCPQKGCESVRVNKTRVSAAGIRSHSMQCKKCGIYYSIADNVFEQYKEAKGI